MTKKTIKKSNKKNYIKNKNKNKNKINVNVNINNSKKSIRKGGGNAKQQPPPQPFVMPSINIQQPAQQQDNNQYLYQLLNRFLDDNTRTPSLISSSVPQLAPSYRIATNTLSNVQPIDITTNTQNDLLNAALPRRPQPIPQPVPIPIPEPIPIPIPEPIPAPIPAPAGPRPAPELRPQLRPILTFGDELKSAILKPNLRDSKQPREVKSKPTEPETKTEPGKKSASELMIEEARNRRQSIEPDDNDDDNKEWGDKPPDKPTDEPTDEPPDEPPPLEEIEEDEGSDILQKMESTSKHPPTTVQGFMVSEEKSSENLLNVSKIGMDIKEESEDERKNRIQENIPVAEVLNIENETENNEPIEINDATPIATNLKEANQMVNSKNRKILTEAYDLYIKNGGENYTLKQLKGGSLKVSTSTDLYNIESGKLKQRNDFIEKIKMTEEDKGELTEENKKNIRKFLKDNGETQQKIHASTFNAKLKALKF